MHGLKAVRAAALAITVIASSVLLLSGALAQTGKVEGAVDPSLVCMVNDRYMGGPQIPVEVDGRTYYGCCAGCVGKIKKHRSVRYSTDPLTGEEVDKATAVILKGPVGEALYFENEETAREYRSSAE